MITLKMDDNLNESLICGFLAAIYSFGKESLRDKMATISIESPDARLESYYYEKKLKYPLIAFGLLSKSVPSQDFKRFAEAELSRFVEIYGGNVNEFPSHVQEYGPFEDSLRKAISEHFEIIDGHFEQKLDDIFLRVSHGDFQGLDEI